MENKTLKENAKEYVLKRTLNVTDLDKVDLSFPMENRTGIDKEGNNFEYKVIVMNEQEYRVAGTVLGEIQKILKLKPEAKFVKVTSSGSGLNTKYEVEYVEEESELPPTK
jgi:hypothetical protein